MSQQLQPSTAAIRADQLPAAWIASVAAAIREGGHGLRRAGDHQIEVYSDRTKEWHPLSPIFVNAAERDLVLNQLYPI